MDDDDAVAYETIVTPHCEQALRDVRDYIAGVLLSPGTAKRRLEGFREAIHSLAFMPQRVALIPEQPWHDEGVRRLLVGSYYLYFWIDEETKVVYVTDVIYAGRDQGTQLEAMPIE